MGPKSVLFSCTESSDGAGSGGLMVIDFDNLEVNMRAEPVLLRVQRQRTEPASVSCLFGSLCQRDV